MSYIFLQHQTPPTSRASEMASAKPKQHAKKSAAGEDVDPMLYFENRLRFLAAQKESGSNPYPQKFESKSTMPEYVKRYSLNSGDHLEDVEEKIADASFGRRLMNKHSSSSKLFFYDMHGGGTKVQVMADAW